MPKTAARNRRRYPTLPLVGPFRNSPSQEQPWRLRNMNGTWAASWKCDNKPENQEDYDLPTLAYRTVFSVMLQSKTERNLSFLLPSVIKSRDLSLCTSLALPVQRDAATVEITAFGLRLLLVYRTNLGIAKMV
ncbi:hypothetical protein TESG_00471 [Trichophyton tonsurans CBS 112818]|uniref:Uncharacterized protein n=2 Tax=Trichophyton TaxID=5550 RepID=F2PQF9_TRIEC|nr:hypothetical protein TESG_00471 [Trichophyton tonsurans CBS 112818]EGE04127.1 hypothetical protein TEQG_03159 [Trichophyton equinum CBS 127.97]